MKAKDRQEFVKRWTGLVTVISGEVNAKLTSIQKTTDGKIKLFPNDASTVTIKLADLPKESKRVIKANMTDGRRFRVRLNEDGDGVETVTPASGVFVGCKFVGIGPKDQNENYKLIHKVYNEGQKNENQHDEFFAKYEITSGVFKGVELPAYYMHYKFEEIPEGDEQEGFTQFNTADTPQASQLHKLQNWAEVHGGVLDDPIKWPDDGIILDVIEERVLENDISVTLVFEDGWIKSIQADENYDEPEGEVPVEDEIPFDSKFPEKPVKDDEVEEIPAKEPAKKSTGKKPPKASASDDEL